MIEYRGCKIYTKRQTGGCYQADIELPDRQHRYVDNAGTQQSAVRQAKIIADEVIDTDQIAARWFRTSLI